MRHQELTRDQRTSIITLHLAGFKYKQIQDWIRNNGGAEVSIRQVQHAIERGHPTPQKKGHVGKKSTLTEDQINDLEVLVCSSKAGRLLSYTGLSSALDLGVSVDVIRAALQKRGYKRYIARQKPPLSEKNKELRLAWAQEHKDWTLQQWSLILWTDETWVTGGRHRRQWVTRKVGEELHPDCVLAKVQRRKGWMFWGCFAGGNKGPSLFWEKEWGSIDQKGYSERIIPLIDGWIRMNPELLLMQDHAPSHAGKVTRQELLERRIRLIEWPPFSPDLNPIETVWNWMKNWIEEQYGPEANFTWDQLREVVTAAWEAVPRWKLLDLLESMPQRCADVIQAGGGHTKW